MKTMAGGYWDGRAKQQPIPAKPALKWALSNPGITTAIPGHDHARPARDEPPGRQGHQAHGRR